jgi:ribose 5-phosphate isomerase B
MRIYLASDHAGFELKEKIKKYLEDLKYEIKDFGAFKHEPEDDYPDFIFPAMKALSSDVQHSVLNSRGIIFGGSGIGECIVANRIKGIRAVRAWDVVSAKMSRCHNNANVLCLGGGKTVDKTQNVGISFTKAKRIVDTWLATPFSGEPRHLRRIEKIDKLFM